MFEVFNFKDSHQNAFTRRKLECVMWNINLILFENNYYPMSKENFGITLLYLAYCFDGFFTMEKNSTLINVKRSTLISLFGIQDDNPDLFSRPLHTPIINTLQILSDRGGQYEEEFKEFELFIFEIFKNTNQSLILKIRNIAEKDSLFLVTNQKRGLMPVKDDHKYIVPAVQKFCENMSYLNLLNK